MRCEGYLPEPGIDEEQMFKGATEFARCRGKITIEGFFLRQFKTGTYAEYKGQMMWFEGRRLKEVREALEARLKAEREQDNGESDNALE
jgi:CRISPR/Cas system CMR-associated protein Cmr1 (group 7 of RAMP superfamily)